MRRRGTITLIMDDGSGIITDENEQEIPFKLERRSLTDANGAPVSFEIEFGSAGLEAVGIQILS